MNMSDRAVYVGGKRYFRTVWNLHRRNSDGATFGFIRFAGQQFKVWQVGDGQHEHWTTSDPATAEPKPRNDFELGAA